MNIKEINIASTNSLGDAPKYVRGGFQRSVTVYTVARKGNLTKVGFSDECTMDGDEPSETIVVPNAPQVLIVTKTTGNRGDTYARLYTK